MTVSNADFERSLEKKGLLGFCFIKVVGYGLVLNDESFCYNVRPLLENAFVNKFVILFNLEWTSRILMTW